MEVLSDRTAEQENNEQRQHLDNDNRPTAHLDIDFRPDFEQESNRTEHLAEQFKIIGLSNRKSTPDFRFRTEQPNTCSDSYSSSWFPTVARYLFVSQDLRSRHG